MNSSISSSEFDDPGLWRRWLATLLSSAILGSGLILLFVIVLDPYSTGRLTPITRIDVALGPRASHAARVRNLQFNSAIFGNSHAYRLEPVRLDGATGRHFAQLTMEKTYPPEQTFLAREFELRRQGKDVLLVMVLDDLWCAPTRETNDDWKMPRWLYEGSNFDYARGVFSQVAFRAALYRLKILSGLAGDYSRPDGYDPEPWVPLDVAKIRRKMAVMARPTDAPDADAPFPFFDDLAIEIDHFERHTAVLLMFPPVYAGVLPAPGSRAEARFSACAGRAQQIVAVRPGTGYLDLRSDDATTRDVNRFVDPTHPDDGIAQAIIPKIAVALRHLTSAN